MPQSFLILKCNVINFELCIYTSLQAERTAREGEVIMNDAMDTREDSRNLDDMFTEAAAVAWGMLVLYLGMLPWWLLLGLLSWHPVI